MHIHFIQHAPFEHPGSIINWAMEKGHQFATTRLYLGERLPALDAIDFLILMGGPQSTRELDCFPYLEEEAKFTRHAMQSDIPVLGICLGAQLIALSLGAEAKVSPQKEIGMYPVQLTAQAGDDPVFSTWPHSLEVMHWHGEMAGFAQGCVLLAKSEGCPIQAFRYGDRVYALQFHLEMTKDLAQEMIENCSDDLIPGSFIQDARSILEADFTAMNKRMIEVLEYLSTKKKVG